ncbi:acetyl-CoA carboxylase biotin carboxyl carrier protein subunit [Thermococcus sp.]|uniref:acetyl-CoA carboxylase biotin carboxyl carrier protein subunit n=1 Tax=Thermococcus sp. TaxID=35749 RepID=UPI002605068E|nr:acetyl-CoA carboxylase biotin carboxyl carrier protein subunit [Thermococcus sp.]
MAKVRVIIDGVEYEVEVEELPNGRFRVSFEGKNYEVEAEGLGITLPSTAPAATTVEAPAVQPPTPAPASVPAPAPVSRSLPAGSENVVTAPMPGKVLRILVSEGDRVRVGQGLLVLEAMKMENEIPAPRDGVVKKIYVKEGDTVDTGQPLIELG